MIVQSGNDSTLRMLINFGTVEQNLRVVDEGGGVRCWEKVELNHYSDNSHAQTEANKRLKTSLVMLLKNCFLCLIIENLF